MKSLSFYGIIVLISMTILTGNAYAQDRIRIRDVKRFCDAGLYQEGISLGYAFLKDNPTNFEVHYILGQSYKKRAAEIVMQQNKNIELRNVATWIEDDYLNVLAGYQTLILYQDSSILFFKKASSLVNDVFLTKNLTVCSSGLGTCYSEFFTNQTISSARQFISNLIFETQDALTSNRATFRSAETIYYSYKEKMERRQQDKLIQPPTSNSILITAKFIKLSIFEGEADLFFEKEDGSNITFHRNYQNFEEPELAISL